MTKIPLRTFALTIGRKNGFAKKFENFKIDFNIRKSLERTPNKSTIKIHNLSLDSLSTFSLAEELYAILEIGYDGDIFVLIEGDVENISIDRTSGNSVMTIFIKDGAKAINKTISNKVFTKGTDTKRIIEELVETMVKSGELIVSEITNKVINLFSGKKEKTQTALVGNTAKSLEKILKKYNKRFSIQNNVLEIIDENGNDGKKAPLLSPTTGLIGNPVPTKKGIRIKAELKYTFKPGSVVEIQSEFINGQYTIQTSSFTGSNRENDFFAEMVVK